MIKNLICFDLDDTLIDDNFKFELTFCDCIKAILNGFETRAPQIDEILSLARQIDNEKLSSWPLNTKYTPARLMQTWIDTYKTLCEKHKVENKEYVNLLLTALVKQNFEPPYYIIPGAIETISTLSALPNTELAIITTGSQEVQNRKITKTGMDKFFKEIFIVPDGNKEAVLEKLISKYEKENIIMVGNSIKSDINPALKLGINAIHIPRGSWHHFNAEPLNDKYIKIMDISELERVYRELKTA